MTFVPVAVTPGPSRAIPVRNAWYLLLYAWDLAKWGVTTHGDVERSPTLLALLARVLASTTRDLLRRNLARSFDSQRESIRGVRGRIDFGVSLKRLDFEAGRAHCTFPQLSIDTLRNRILRATLDRLARDGCVDHPPLDAARELRQELRSLVRAMDGVTLVPPTAHMFGQLQLGRNDGDYALPLAICELVHRLELPTEAAGDHALAALLRDEITFHQLFERFVRNFWRTHLDEQEVRRETLQWFDELGCTLVPSMITDITLVQRSAPHRRVVVDTKYYRFIRDSCGSRLPGRDRGHRSGSRSPS
jgi:5-methylcytosine-specific restriction enzyme subunit McrC